jgi:hypothetical protein
MDALTFHRGDHESVLGMLEVLHGAPTRGWGQGEPLDDDGDELDHRRIPYEPIEEQLFWPAARDALDDGDEIADHAIEQEEAAKKLLQRLEDSEPAQWFLTQHSMNSSRPVANTSCTSKTSSGRSFPPRSAAKSWRSWAKSWSLPRRRRPPARVRIRRPAPGGEKTMDSTAAVDRDIEACQVKLPETQ